TYGDPAYNRVEAACPHAALLLTLCISLESRLGDRGKLPKAAIGKRLRFCNPKGIVPFGPALRGTSYPGLLPRGFSTPTGLCQISAIEPQPRWGCLPFAEISQGSSSLATLGFEPESRWDSALEFPKGITPSP